MLSDSVKGFSLVACSILLLSLSLDSMQDIDDVENEFERECDPMFRSLIGNYSAIDAETCDQLDKERSRKLAVFSATLATFVITGLIGAAMLLPSTRD